MPSVGMGSALTVTRVVELVSILALFLTKRVNLYACLETTREPAGTTSSAEFANSSRLHRYCISASWPTVTDESGSNDSSPDRARSSDTENSMFRPPEITATSGLKTTRIASGAVIAGASEAARPDVEVAAGLIEFCVCGIVGPCPLEVDEGLGRTSTLGELRFGLEDDGLRGLVRWLPCKLQTRSCLSDLLQFQRLAITRQRPCRERVRPDGRDEVIEVDALEHWCEVREAEVVSEFLVLRPTVEAGPDIRQATRPRHGKEHLQVTARVDLGRTSQQRRAGSEQLVRLQDDLRLGAGWRREAVSGPEPRVRLDDRHRVPWLDRGARSEHHDQTAGALEDTVRADAETVDAFACREDRAACSARRRELGLAVGVGVEQHFDRGPVRREPRSFR
eukprot:36150-Rhodomonas_salina.1